MENAGISEPALLRDCKIIYEKMQETANEDIDGGTAWQWVGSLVRLFADTGLPTPKYTAVMRALREMGCCEQMQRGGGGSPSIWRLIKPPTQQDFDAKANASTKAKKIKEEVADQRIRDLSLRVSSLETQLDQTRRQLENLEIRMLTPGGQVA